jgi:hypothetical protein
MRLLRLLRSLWRQEFGQGLVLGTLAMIVILGFAALVLDVGLFLHEKRELQKAVDAAALAAARELPDSWAQAEADAGEWLEKNDVDGTDGDTVDISFTCTSEYAIACDPAADRWDTIVVHAERNVPLNFAPLLGLDDITVSATAAGCQGLCGATPFRSLDVMMVLDRTLSMSHSDLQNAKDGALAVLQVFDADWQQVGLAAIPSGKKSDPCGYPSNIGWDASHPDWVLVGLSDDFQNPDGSLNWGSDLVDTIDCLRQPSGAYAQTNLGDPLAAAVEELVDNGRPDAPQGIIFLSDGAANRPDDGSTGGWFGSICGPEPDAMKPCEYALQKAEEAKAQGIEIYTIGYGVAGERCECDRGGVWYNRPASDLLKEMATDEYHYYEEPRGDDLTPVFETIGWRLVSGIRLVPVLNP